MTEKLTSQDFEERDPFKDEVTDLTQEFLRYKDTRPTLPEGLLLRSWVIQKLAALNVGARKRGKRGQK